MDTSPDCTMRVHRLDPEATLPVRAHEGDLGLDLSSVRDYQINQFERVLIETGISIEFPANIGGLIKDRSSLAVRGLHTLAGVIDAGYRGPIKVLAINFAPEKITIAKGERIAQLVPVSVISANVQWSESDQAGTATSRGTGGFGSTGRS